MSNDGVTVRRTALANFLRTRRAQVTPAEAGLEPGGGLRRTPGLRREEVALLSGVGITWYTWLEQGRDINPSPEVLGAIARTLRLNEASRDYLFRLAGQEPRTAGSGQAGSAGGAAVPESLVRLVHAQDPAPTVLTDAHWRALCTLLDPSVSSDDRWQTAEGRRRSQDTLDEVVRNFTTSHAGRELAKLLQEAGVPAAFVVLPEDLPTEPELLDREFFVTMTHPIWGEGRIIGLPWRPAGAPATSLAPPPILGDAGDGPAVTGACAPSPWT